MDRTMDEYLARQELFIPMGSILRIDDGRGTLLTVNRGAVWLTQQDDLRDIFRESNQSFLLDRDGTTVVYACHHTVVTLTPAGVRPKQIRVIHPKAANDEREPLAVGG
jgi:hypothetical protein